MKGYFIAGIIVGGLFLICILIKILTRKNKEDDEDDENYGSLASAISSVKNKFYKVCGKIKNRDEGC